MTEDQTQGMIESMKVIHATTQKEAESIIELYPDKHDEERTKSLETFRQHFKETQKGDRILYLLKDDGKTIGTVSLVLSQENMDEPRLFGPKIGHINHLRIHPDYQGRKLAGMLNSRLEADATRLGLETLTLGVEPNNHKAIDIYSHWGYENFLEYQGDAGHGKTETIIGMKKNLQE